VSKVICNSRHGCEEAYVCGGAKPHDRQKNECNGCPMNKDARCIEAKINEYPQGKLDA